MVGLGTVLGHSRRFAHDSTRTYPLPVNVDLPKLDNYTPKVGDGVSVFDPGEWLATPAVDHYSYQLQLDRVDIGVPSNTILGYTTLTADAGKRLRWGVYAWNTPGGRSVLIAYTQETEPIVAIAALPKPVNITPPVVLGLVPPAEGQTASVQASAWASPPYTLATKWQREAATNVWADIASAINTTYTYVAGDVTHRIRVGQLATNASGAAVSGYIFSTPTEAVEAVTPPGTRVAGIAYQPTYVVTQTRPATFAAAQTFAAAHPELYPTGLVDVNSYANFEAGIDAANTADKALAIGIDNDVGHYTISATKRYLKRGIIGFGSANPDITFARTSANILKSPHLFAHTQNIALRFTKWINCDYILISTRETLPLLKNGVVTQDPCLGASNLAWANSDAGKNAAAFRCLRCGKLTPSGSGNITALFMRRQIEGSAWTIGTHLTAAYEQYLENIDLIGGATITSVTPTKIKDAINLNTGTHGVSAILSDDSLSVILLKSGRGYPLELIATCTGSLTCGTNPTTPWTQDSNNNTWGVGFDVQFNEAVDCTQVLGWRTDSSAVGLIYFHKNDLLGTWSGAAGMGTRWAGVFGANNIHHDCYLGRAAAPGRTVSRQPNGQTLSIENTLFGSIAGCSIHADRYQSTVLLIENNDGTNVESTQTQDNANCSVFCHFIGGWDRATFEGQTGGWTKHSWNKISVYGRPDGGDDDGNWCYGNTQGLEVSHNAFDRVGTGWAQSPGLLGAEGVMTFKEGGFVNPNPLSQGIRAQRHYNGPSGIPLWKTDSKEIQLHEQVYWENFSVTKGGVAYVSNVNSGGFAILGILSKCAIRQFFFYNCDKASVSGWLGLWGRIVATNMNFVDFEINNIYFQNDGINYPEYTGDTLMFNFSFNNFPTGLTVSTLSANFNANAKVRDCYVLNAAGAVVGEATGQFQPDGIINRTFRNNGRGAALPRLTSVDTDGIPHFGAVW